MIIVLLESWTTGAMEDANERHVTEEMTNLSVSTEWHCRSATHV